MQTNQTKHLEVLLKLENKKTVEMVGKQQESLQKFKESVKFFNCVGLTRFNTYFEFRLYTFLTKPLILNNSSRSHSYFKSNLSNMLQHWIKEGIFFVGYLVKNIIMIFVSINVSWFLPYLMKFKTFLSCLLLKYIQKKRKKKQQQQQQQKNTQKSLNNVTAQASSFLINPLLLHS